MNTAATLSAKDRLHDLVKTLQTAAGQSTLPEDRLLVEASRMIASNAAAALAALYQGTTPEGLAKAEVGH